VNTTIIGGPKLVIAESMKRLVRQIVAAVELFESINDIDLVGNAENNVFDGYNRIYLSLQESLDKRIWAEIEENGGITRKDLPDYDRFIAKIAGTRFEEAPQSEFE